jgi:NitT/TauT family transport system permease protein
MIKKMVAIVPHILFVILVALVLTPSGNDDVKGYGPFLVVLILIEAFLIMNHKKIATADIGIIVYAMLIIWEIYATKAGGTKSVLFPTPENVFQVYVSDYPKIFEGIIRSLILLLESFFLAIVLGCGLGFIVGISDHLTSFILPIAKVLSPIPAIVYTPYAVRLLPTFRSASVFIITLTIFWGMFMSMIMSVRGIDKKMIDSAKTLNVSKATLIKSILIPYSIPKVMDSLGVSVSTSFIVLTSAEMLGGTSGLGWYVKYHSDFSQYDQVINGIITIGVVVTFLNFLLNWIRKKAVRWQ